MSFGGFVQPGLEADMLFQKAIIEVMEQIYKDDVQDQSAADEFASLVTSNFEIDIVNPATNAIYLGKITILALRVVGPLGFVTTLLPHNLMDGEYIVISGVQGITNVPDGTYSVNVTSSTTFQVNIPGIHTGTYIQNSGTFYAFDIVQAQPLQLIDFYHLLNATPTYTKIITPPRGISSMVVGATNAPTGQPIVISLFTYNNIRTGELIYQAGFSANTNANGTFYVYKLNDTSYALYQDKNFQLPVSGNGNFVAGDTMVIGRAYSNAAKKYNPDEIISPLSKPSEDSPRYLESDSMLNFYPQPPILLTSVSCTYIRLPMDVYRGIPAIDSYARAPYLFISTMDGTVDLATYYHFKFLERLPEAAIEIYSRQVANPQLMQQTTLLDQKNR